ncbi:thyroid adenoma-associated protein homolog [Physella acuta]|uniref:thyroid adenoma-associated protein homolog n=1 Tax=Physella acuta TaxID=109671 RepID=UPI0027DB1814|nr:thyroid adenoma-associated protein homolog [Physella acuta]
MALAELNTVLVNLLAYRSGDISKLIKSLDNYSQKLKCPEFLQDFNNASEETKQALIETITTAYCHALNSPKLARMLDKIIKLLPKRYIESWNIEIESTVQLLLSNSNLSNVKLFSALLEQNLEVKEISKKYFASVTVTIKDTLKCLSEKSIEGSCLEEYLHHSFKLSIQVLQQFAAEIQSLFCNVQENLASNINETLLHDWEKIFVLFLDLFSMNSKRDILLLMGTSIAMALHLMLDVESVGSGFKELISIFTKEKTTFNYKRIHINMRQYQIPEDTSVHVLAIIKGALVTCDKKTWCMGQVPLLLHTFKEIVKLCKGSSEHHYLAFQLFALWYQKTAQIETIHLSTACVHELTVEEACIKDGKEGYGCLSQTNSAEGIDREENNQSNSVNRKIMLMSKNCPVLELTLSCIWLNWDSPVDGVSEFVHEIFSHMLSIWHQNVMSGTSDNVDLGKHLLNRVLSISWKSRSRYRPLTLLLPYVNGRQIIDENPQLKEDLLCCMKTNHMAATASDVYKAFLKRTVEEHSENSLHVWKEIWMPVLIKGITTSDMLQRLKVCTYWLPPTLKLVPHSYSALLCCLEDKMIVDNTLEQQKDRYLFGWVAVSRVVREHLHLPLPTQSLPLLQKALLCVDEGTRAEALMLISTTMKKAEPLSQVEAQLLREFIPANLKTDSAPFRQSLSSGLKKVLTRIRDSCLSAVRKDRNDDFLSWSLQFVDWLYQVLMLSLAPGSCYQRRQTVFDLLSDILDTLVYDDQDTSKKGKAKESSQHLLKFAQAKGLWDFFKKEYFLSILTCLEDGAEEIQNQAFSLLMKFLNCKEALQTSLLSEDRATVLHLLRHAFELTGSPRAYENHSGLLILSLVLNRYVIGCGLKFSITANETSKIEVEHQVDSGDCPTDPVLSFVELLLSQVKTSLDSVLLDLAVNFKLHPIHGITECLSRTLADISKCSQWTILSSEAGGHILKNIVAIQQRIVTLILDVLSGGKALEDCPSFADMGIALQNLISDDEEVEGDKMSISPDFQLLLSWCWINLRESCSCLGEVTRVGVLNNECCLSINELQAIGDTFVKVLTTCRHRGAIEGCREGWFQFCCSLMSASDPQLSNIPKQILQQILDSLSGNSLTSSVTRRSAGLPIIVQTVLLASRKSGDNTLLISTINNLYLIASRPLPADCSQLQDLSQGHALNILKVIFCDASFAPVLMFLLSKMTILVVEGFDSSSWAIRNAATQLISTLITRIFGQKNTAGNNNNMTLEEFEGLYPELLLFVHDKLLAYVASRTTVKPSLYIILTLLSSIGMSPSQQHSSNIRSSLQNAVLFFLSNPVHSLRKLAAQAYVALSPLDEVDTTMQHLLDRLKQREVKMNERHGWLLSALSLISTGVVSDNMCRSLVEFLVQESWLLNCSSCAVIPSAMLEFVCVAVAQTQIGASLAAHLWDVARNLLTSLLASKNQLIVSCDHCMSVCVKLMFELQREMPSCVELRVKLDNIITESLVSTQEAVRSAVLDCLQENNTDAFTNDICIQKLLKDYILRESNHVNLHKSAEIILATKVKGNLRLQYSDLKDFLMLASRVSVQAQCAQTTIFSLHGLVFASADFIQLKQILGSLSQWCDQLLNYTKPSANENIRLLASHALCISGKNIIGFCCAHKDSADADIIAVSLVKASLHLLEDTERDARLNVSSFLCSLMEIKPLHFTFCYHILSKVIVEQLGWCAGVISTLANILYSPHQLSTAISSHLRSGPVCLFEPETDSILSEQFISQLWAYKTLQMLASQGVVLQLLSSTIESVLKELLQHVNVIKKNLSNEVAFNMSSNSKVMSALLGIILISKVYVNSMNSIGKEFTADGLHLLKLIVDIQELPFLHPFLHKPEQNEAGNMFSLVPAKLDILLIGSSQA